MGQLTVYGASDDLVEFEGHADGEIGCYERPVDVMIGEGNRLTHLRLRHTGSEGWVLSLLMPTDVDEDDWQPYEATVSARDYSPAATFDLPDGCPVRALVGGYVHPIE